MDEAKSAIDKRKQEFDDLDSGKKGKIDKRTKLYRNAKANREGTQEEIDALNEA